MRLGVSLAQTGRLADPAAIRSAAIAAEQIGYSSVWVADRCEPAPGDLAAEGFVTALDPVAVLGYAAACTTSVHLGTSVPAAPGYPLGLLARSLWSLDVVSDGRLTIGLDATASTTQLDAAIDVLDHAWAGAAPHRTRPPVLLASTSASGLERVARRSDGWNPADLPADVLANMWTTVRDLAAGFGRDPDALQLVVRATIDLRDEPIDGERAPYAGSDEQVAADIEDTRRAGADEIVLDVRCDDCLDDALGIYASVAETCEMAHAA